VVNLGRRMTVLAAVTAFAFAAMVTRLWFLQVLASEEYRERAAGNYVRLIPVPAPRGRILDRGGQPLVDNRRAVVLTVDRQKVKDEEALLTRLGDILDTSTAELEEKLHDPDFLPYQPVPVYEGVPEPVALYIKEHAEDFPGVEYRETGVRSYVEGDLAPHVIGYLGQISPDELRDPSFSDIRPGQLVGGGGVEQHYEDYLRGEDGWLKQEVDASGKVHGVLGVEPATPGDDLVLAIDGRIQRLAQDTLADAMEQARGIATVTGYLKATAGAVVVLDPNDGHVLALASAPAYDPRVFLQPMSQREYQQRFEIPAQNFPLNNRAVSGQYPAGSTFKPFVASAALRAGYAKVDGSYNCPSEFVVPGDTSGTVFHNWTDVGAGYISFAEALIRSCDTVFYDWGLDFYAERQPRGEFMQHHLRQWGFGSITGVDIPAEAEGRVPDARWKQDVHAQYPELFPEPTWLPGDNINMSIGQGDLLVTPLQLASAYAALANGGTLYRPQIALQVQRPEDGALIREFEGDVIGRVPITEPHRQAIVNALRGVVSSGTGTATTAFAGFPLETHPVAGKTGTAEVAGRQDHSWFAAFAPADDPQFVVVALVEEGGHGSQVAAPIVRRVLEGLLDLEPGAFHIASEVTD
jgi:penicillin-binding protein 2